MQALLVETNVVVVYPTLDVSAGQGDYERRQGTYVAMRLLSSLLDQTDANMLGMSGDVYNSNATAYSRRARTMSHSHAANLSMDPGHVPRALAR